jgi:hypothetical protein
VSIDGVTERIERDLPRWNEFDMTTRVASHSACAVPAGLHERTLQTIKFQRQMHAWIGQQLRFNPWLIAPSLAAEHVGRSAGQLVLPVGALAAESWRRRTGP